MFTDDAIVDLIWRVVILSPIALLWVILNVRVVGLRSFSKMTAFDFVITVATGSLLASAVTTNNWTDFVQTLGSISLLLMTQFSISKFRSSSSSADQIITNDPVWLFKDGKFLDNNMASSRITKDDIYGKLREANALNMSEVHGVILETTGDISVLHGANPDSEILPDFR